MDCEQRFTTYERAILTPMLIKRDGNREAFDREKLAVGIRIACAKRPVSASAIDRMVGEVENTLVGFGETRSILKDCWRYRHDCIERIGLRGLYSLCDCLPWAG